MQNFHENNPFFRLPLHSVWQGRSDNHLKERFFQIVSFFDSYNTSILSNPNTTALIGFSCDEGVRRNQGRRGAKEGPLSLRQSLANYPLHGNAMQMHLIDVGDIICVENKLEEAQISLGEHIQILSRQKVFTIVLGGGHETAFGHYLGLREKWEKTNFAIVNFDAHFDMRPLSNAQGTSGTPFLQIANLRQKQGYPFHYYCMGISPYRNTQSLFETAKKWQVDYLTCDQIYASQESAKHFVEKIIHKHDFIYVSICLDVFSENIAPGVSSLSPYGLLPYQVIPLIRQLALSSKVIALDVVELAPCFDKQHMTANLGALCISEFLYHHARQDNP